jgi:glycosyltransferase involved in cell wall biosynthesis
MKILFTQFTPPFSQTNSSLINLSKSHEQQYLNYVDWYSILRMNLAENNEVKFVSLTLSNEKKVIDQDGYQSLFFPLNKKPPLKNRIKQFYNISEFDSDQLIEWVTEYSPDVVHIMGTGHLLSRRLVGIDGYGNRTCIWERGIFRKELADCFEIQKSNNYILPTKEKQEIAKKYINKDKLLSFPLGANLDRFKPLNNTSKLYDIVSVGGIGGTTKRIDLVQEIVKNNNLSWVHAGGIVEGEPFYTKLEDFIYARKYRKYLGMSRIRISNRYSHKSGFFENTKLMELYNQAKIMVHPSIREGAPRAVQEALACEIPVVVLKSTVPYVEPEFGIACASHEEFEDAVLGLLADDEKRKNMGKAGREWLIENHSPEKLAMAVEKVNQNIYEEGIGK